MIELKNVKKTYPDFQLDVSMEIPNGHIAGLIGKNGAGKSTTIKTILQLVAPEAGSIRLFSKEIGSGKRQLSKLEKQKIGVVLSDSGFSGWLTVSDICALCGSMYVNFDKERFLEHCRRMELPMDAQVKTFSTGMKAKLKVIVALSHQADVLILDEPTAGLDVIARDSVLELLRSYMEEKEERSILISSHISSDLESLCDSLYLISDGSILLHEDTDVLLSDYAVLKVTKEQYEQLDKRYIRRSKKESFGYACLTSEKRYYMENYPDIVVEHTGIDDLILLMEKGKVVA